MDGGRSLQRAPAGQRALLLGDGFELLVIVVRVLRELVVVEVLVATVAGELLTLALGLFDHVLHELRRRVPAALRASLRRGRVALDRDLARALVARVGDAGR